MDLKSPQLDKKMGERFLRTESVTLVTFLSFVESNTYAMQYALRFMHFGKMHSDIRGEIQIPLLKMLRINLVLNSRQLLHILLIKMGIKEPCGSGPNDD